MNSPQKTVAAALQAVADAAEQHRGRVGSDALQNALNALVALPEEYYNQLGVAGRLTERDADLQVEVRAAWETQFWLNNTLSDDVYGIGTNLALTGPGVALELTY